MRVKLIRAVFLHSFMEVLRDSHRQADTQTLTNTHTKHHCDPDELKLSLDLHLN